MELQFFSRRVSVDKGIEVCTPLPPDVLLPAPPDSELYVNLRPPVPVDRPLTVGFGMLPQEGFTPGLHSGLIKVSFAGETRYNWTSFDPILIAEASLP